MKEYALNEPLTEGSLNFWSSSVLSGFLSSSGNHTSSFEKEQFIFHQGVVG